MVVAVAGLEATALKITIEAGTEDTLPILFQAVMAAVDGFRPDLVAGLEVVIRCQPVTPGDVGGDDIGPGVENRLCVPAEPPGLAHLGPLQWRQDTEPAPSDATDWESVEIALEHKRRVRTAATARANDLLGVARLDNHCCGGPG